MSASRARAAPALALVGLLGALASACVTTSTAPPPCACNAPQQPQEQQITGGGHVSTGN